MVCLGHDKRHLVRQLLAERFTTVEAIVSLLSMRAHEQKRGTHDARNEFENANGMHEFTKGFPEYGALTS